MEPTRTPRQSRRQIFKYHELAHELDEGRVQKGRFFKKHPVKHRVQFVAHRPQPGREGTDLTLDVVDHLEDTKDMVLDTDVFQPANPTYLVFSGRDVTHDWSTSAPPLASIPELPDEDQEYQLVDPKKVLWTSTIYEDEQERGPFNR